MLLINKKKLTHDELLFVESVLINSGDEEGFYNFNCPVSLKVKTYLQLIQNYIDKYGDIPRTKTTTNRGYSEFLAIKIYVYKWV